MRNAIVIFIFLLLTSGVGIADGPTPTPTPTLAPQPTVTAGPVEAASLAIAATELDGLRKQAAQQKAVIAVLQKKNQFYLQEIQKLTAQYVDLAAQAASIKKTMSDACKLIDRMAANPKNATAAASLETVKSRLFPVLYQSVIQQKK